MAVEGFAVVELVVKVQVVDAFQLGVEVGVLSSFVAVGGEAGPMAGRRSPQIFQNDAKTPARIFFLDF